MECGNKHGKFFWGIVSTDSFVISFRLGYDTIGDNQAFALTIELFGLLFSTGIILD